MNYLLFTKKIIITIRFEKRIIHEAINIATDMFNPGLLLPDAIVIQEDVRKNNRLWQ
jgi:hypothetical protein